MNHLTLTTDQAALVGSSGSTMLVRDPAGQPVGILAVSNRGDESLRNAFSDEELESAEFELRSTTERRTTAQVVKRLDDLAAQAR